MTKKTAHSSQKLPVKASNKELAPTVLPSDRSPQEALQSYIAEIKKHPLLSAEAEHSAAKKYYETKDPASAQLLILSNLRLVVKIAYDYTRAGVNILDLIQEGNIGLLQAVKEFDPHRGVKLSSYASYWIKAYIRSFIIKNWSLVKIGTTRAQRSLFYQLQKEKNRLEILGLPVEPKYLAERLNVKEREITEMSQRMSGKDVSLNAPLRADEGDGDTLLQQVRDRSESVEDRMVREEIAQEFTSRLDHFERSLTGKELLVFRERLRAEEPKTLQEIGDAYGITRERIRQIESRVMEKLKAYMKENARFMEQTYDV